MQRDSQKPLPSVLIIDDEAVLRDFLSGILRSFNITSVRNASTLQRAEQILAEEEIDIVFLDIQLNKENGLDELPLLKNWSPKTDFIMVSAHSSMDNARAAVAYGAKGFVVKPFTAKKIEGLLKTLNYLS